MSNKKKRSAAAIGRQNRQKGRKAEQAVVDLLKAAGYSQARRWPANMPAPSGELPPDLIVPELPWLNAEVKHAESMTPWKLLDQADTQGKPGQLSVGFMRKDSKAGPGQPSDRPLVVVMRPEAWLELVAYAELAKNTSTELERLDRGTKPEPAMATLANLRVDGMAEQAKAWLRELRALAGPARDPQDIREDLQTLAGRQVVGPGGGRADAVVARLAEDLGMGELYPEEGRERVICAACHTIQAPATEAPLSQRCEECGEPIGPDTDAVRVRMPR